MNRGNLAEDPRSGLTSSSRYSRGGEERNSLLYVDSSSARRERKAREAAARAKNGSDIKGNQKKNSDRSVGRGLANSHMNRLEVGSDGRLFHVRESQHSSFSSEETYSDLNIAEVSVNADTISGYKRSKAPASIRPAILSSSDNPLLSKDTKRILRQARKQKSVKAGSSIEAPEAAQEQTSVKTAQAQPAAGAAQEQTSVKTAQAQPVAGAAQEQTSVKTAQAQPVAGAAKTEAAAAGAVVAAAAGSAATYRNPLLPPARKSIFDGFEGIRIPKLRIGSTDGFRRSLIAAVAAVLTAAYCYTGWHFNSHFYPGTEIFGIEADGHTVAEIKQDIKTKVNSYNLEIDARGSEKNVITAADVSMAYQDHGEIEQAMKDQRSWAWPVMMIRQLVDKENLSLQTAYDESLVPAVTKQLPCMDESKMIAPQNAELILTDDGATVEPEIYGTTLNEAKTEEAIRTALNRGQHMLDLDELGLYESPTVFVNDAALNADAMALNKVLGAKIILRFGDRAEVLDSKRIASLLSKKDGEYEISELKVRGYVTRLAEKYDTLQCPRTFHTSIGTTVTLEQEPIGDYGWQIDQEATYEKILEALRSKKKTTFEPVFSAEAFCADANDIGDTYVEISITNQMMWFYRDGQLVVETPVVTGNPYANHSTPTNGVWSLKDRARNQLLVGQGYTSPVDYWMPFNGGVGIHDMQTRAWFGGNVYLGSGSHGCINTPLSAVKLIYEQAQVGMPVVVYTDESDEALSLVTGPTDVQTINAQVEETYGTIEDDGQGSIVYWTKYQKAQAQAAAATTTTTTTASTGGNVW